MFHFGSFFQHIQFFVELFQTVQSFVGYFQLSLSVNRSIQSISDISDISNISNFFYGLQRLVCGHLLSFMLGMLLVSTSKSLRRLRKPRRFGIKFKLRCIDIIFSLHQWFHLFLRIAWNSWLMSTLDTLFIWLLYSRYWWHISLLLFSHL